MSDDRSERLRQRRKRANGGAQHPIEDRASQQSEQSFIWQSEPHVAEPNDGGLHPVDVLYRVRSAVDATARRSRELYDRGGAALPRGLRAIVTGLWRWLALSGDRRLVAAVFLGVGMLVIGPAGHLLAASSSDLPAAQYFTEPLGSTLLVVSAVFILVMMGVAVSSLLDSDEQSVLVQQLLQSNGQFREQLQSFVDVEQVPVRPEPLFRLFARQLLARAQRLQTDLVASDVDLHGDLEAYLTAFVEDTETLYRKLADADTAFDMIRATMDYDHDRQLMALRELQSGHPDVIPSGTADRIAEVVQLLQYFAIVRSHLKTLSIRREFADLARDLVVIAVPSLAALAAMLHFLPNVGSDHLLVAAVEVVALAPFVLVASYVLRVAVVAQRT